MLSAIFLKFQLHACRIASVPEGCTSEYLVNLPGAAERDAATAEAAHKMKYFFEFSIWCVVLVSFAKVAQNFYLSKYLNLLKFIELHRIIIFVQNVKII